VRDARPAGPLCHWQKRLETCFDEVTVRGQGLGHAKLAHQDEARAIGERVTAVCVFDEECLGCVEAVGRDVFDGALCAAWL